MEKRIKEILSDKLGWSLEDLGNDRKLSMDLGVDDLDIVEIIMEIEKEYHVYLPDEKWFGHSFTVGDLIKLVEESGV